MCHSETTQNKAFSLDFFSRSSLLALVLPSYFDMLCLCGGSHGNSQDAFSFFLAHQILKTQKALEQGYIQTTQ